MSLSNIYQYIRLDNHSITPKYLQIANAIIHAIELRQLSADYLLPSINDLSYELEISRDTAEKAYKYLKKRGIIKSIPGKGYFIGKTDFEHPYKVFLLFNKLSAHKKIIYDSFVATLGDKAAIDFYIYNNDYLLFKKLLANQKQTYTHYVIVPHFIDNYQHAANEINLHCKGYVLLLDKLIDGIATPYAAVYENFEKDIYYALQQALPQLSKYQTIKIIFPTYSYFPQEIIKGLVSFCNEYAFNYQIVHQLATEPICKGEVYINLMEEDLVVLLDKILSTTLQVGTDVGIISYNETPLKRFLLNGITTISTNFSDMGIAAAQSILENSYTHYQVPFSLTVRQSL